MTDQEPTPAPDDSSPDAAVANADRGIPQVARAHRSDRVALMLFAAAALGVLVWINWPGDEDDSLIDAQEEQFAPTQPVVAVGPTQPAAVAPPPPPPPQPAAAAPTAPPPDPYAEQQRLRMQELAMQRAMEAERLRQERRRSDIVILDRGGTVAAAGITPAGAGGPASFFGQEGDLTREERFARRADNNAVETVQASRLRNVDKIVPQGTIIAGTLETAIQSDLPGMIRAVVSQDVYSFDGTRLLVPKGTRLIGRYQSGLVRGQERVFVIWSRLLLPDGVSVMVGSPGTDEVGRAGLEGQLDTHFWERFGNSILLSLIDGVIDGLSQRLADTDGREVIISGGADFNRSAEIALENSIDIPPTVYVDQGGPVNVFVAKDLDFTAVLESGLR